MSKIVVERVQARRDLFQKVKELFPNEKVAKPIYEYICDFIEEYDDAPTVDAVEVVRCKDCVCWNEKYQECEGWENSVDLEGGASYRLTFDENDFCSKGKRKTE